MSRGAIVDVTFYGVRGSTPCACDTNRRYGGNTSCVVLEASGELPIVLDLGTGLRLWGLTLPLDGSFKGIALVSHLHWDHVQGLPFFGPVNMPGAELEIIAPTQEDGPLREVIGGFLRPPYFPVTIDALAGRFTYTEVIETTIERGGWTITTASVPHVGLTLGFRVEHCGVSVAYVPDHQQPGCGSTSVSESVLALAQGADLLIHDAQYTDIEFAQKFDWGHCTIDYAVEVARQARARRLALFHHDPLHDDDQLDALASHAARLGASAGLVEVMAASEGMRVSLAPIGAASAQ